MIDHKNNPYFEIQKLKHWFQLIYKEQLLIYNLRSVPNPGFCIIEQLLTQNNVD